MAYPLLTGTTHTVTARLFEAFAFELADDHTWNPTQFKWDKSAEVRLFTPFQALNEPADITASGGTATETDSAVDGTVKVTVGGGTAPETDTAVGGEGTEVITATGGPAGETDVAEGGEIAVGGGPAGETDTAISGNVLTDSFVTGGPAEETDTAVGGTVVEGVTGGTAGETDEAEGGGIVVGGGVASESDSAVPGTGSVVTEVSGSSGGILELDSGFIYSDPEFRIEILDTIIDRAPASVTLTLAGGVPEEEVRFYIDGTLVWTTEADTDGSLVAISLNISSTLGGDTVGSHTITAEQDGIDVTLLTASDTYTIKRLPALNPIVQGADVSPVIVAGSITHDTQHWVFQDLMGVDFGGIGSWVMPMNPSEMSSPHFEHTFASRHTTAKGGQYHITAAGRTMKEWTFSGYAPDQEFLDKLLEYRNLNRRFYIIDHHNRAWKVVLTNVEHVPRLRHTWQAAGQQGVQDDWGSDYTVTAMILDQDFLTPVEGAPGGPDEPGGDPEGISFEEGVSGAIPFEEHPWLFRYRGEDDGVATTTYSSISPHGGERSARLYAFAPEGSSSPDTDAWAECDLAMKFIPPTGEVKFWFRINTMTLDSYVHPVSGYGNSAELTFAYYAFDPYSQYARLLIRFIKNEDDEIEAIYDFDSEASTILALNTWYQIRLDQQVGSVVSTLHDADGDVLVTKTIDTTENIYGDPIDPVDQANFDLYSYVESAGSSDSIVDFRVDDIVVPGTPTPAWDEETL